MVLVFALGLGGAAVLDPFEKHLADSGRYGLVLFREPYQDLSILLTLSLGAVALIWLVSGWSLRHLASASREAALVGASNPAARISTRKLPAEIRPLVQSMNGALDRLAEAYTAEQRFVANAAHELRTPLAVLSLRLQRAKLDGDLDWPAIDRDLAAVIRLAAQLLDLARKDHVRQADISAGNLVNLSRVAREAAAAVVPLVVEAGRTLDVELPGSLPVRGRPDDLRDMLRNLLDNAIVHGRGTIRLTGQMAIGSGNDRQVWIVVSDEGPGVPADLRQAVFERFRKARQESSGHGLGLAIVREVVRGHGGSAEFLPGAACRVRVALPAAERANSGRSWDGTTCHAAFERPAWPSTYKAEGQKAT
jgi:two-component system sensor histidine kinase QseC